jgi:hypothetical protein
MGMSAAEPWRVRSPSGSRRWARRCLDIGPRFWIVTRERQGCTSTQASRGSVPAVHDDTVSLVTIASRSSDSPPSDLQGQKLGLRRCHAPGDGQVHRRFRPDESDTRAESRLRVRGRGAGVTRAS